MTNIFLHSVIRGRHNIIKGSFQNDIITLFVIVGGVGGIRFCYSKLLCNAVILYGVGWSRAKFSL